MDCILSDNFITTHENTMLAKTVVKKKQNPSGASPILYRTNIRTW